MGEFELIRRHFQRARGGPSVALGIGDDCALLVPSPGHQLAISSDMLVEGRHFFADVDPQALGHKALAVNLSDLAAMGARPLGFTLALALPRADDAWLKAFSDGLLALADAHACPLVGGDTTRGPLNLCITVFGEVSPGQAGKKGRCKRCGQNMQVPKAEQLASMTGLNAVSHPGGPAAAGPVAGGAVAVSMRGDAAQAQSMSNWLRAAATSVGLSPLTVDHMPVIGREWAKKIDDDLGDSKPYMVMGGYDPGAALAALFT